MRQTKIDPVDYAREIVHDCLAREFGRTSSAVGTYKPLPGKSGNDGPVWNTYDVALLLAGILPGVAVLVWALTR